MRRRKLLPSLAVLCTFASFGSFAMAQAAATAFPERPLRLVIGQAPGGAVDTVARMLAERLGSVLQQPVVVENKPGAGGMLAAEAIARSAPDGYTLGLLDVGALTVNPVLQKKISYDVARDFSYIGTVARIPLVLVAHPSLQPSSAAELTRYSRAHPAELSYASAGVGSPPHLAFESYKQQSGALVTHLPYRGGAPALADVVAGHVQLTFIDTNLGSQYLKNGRVKAIAVATRERSALMPEVPTFDEAGLKDFEFAPWVGLIAAAGLPPAVSARLAAALATVLANADTGKRLRDIGFVPFGGNATEFAALMQRDLEAHRVLVRKRNIKLED